MACVLDSKFKVIGRVKRKTNGFMGAEAGVARIIETIERAMAEANVTRKQLGGIGLASPGPLDLNRGIILDLVNLGWKQVPIKRILAKTFGVDVVIGKDVDVGTYGEYRRGAAKKARCVLGIFPGTGLGGGCVYEGSVLRGRNGSCLEIGHVQVQPEGPLCGCGRRGCLEVMCSRLAISSAAMVAAYRGEAPELLKRTELNLKDIKSSVLAEAIAAGDKAVEGIVREAARWLGVGISIGVNMLSPDKVVLGGGLIEAMGSIIIPEAEKAARARVMSSFRDEFDIVPARLGDDAGIMGAACLIREKCGEMCQ